MAQVILTALLNDLKNNPTDAIRLAVAWRDPDVIRHELEELQQDDEEGRDGMARAFDEVPH